MYELANGDHRKRCHSIHPYAVIPSEAAQLFLARRYLVCWVAQSRNLSSLYEPTHVDNSKRNSALRHAVIPSEVCEVRNLLLTF